MSGKAIVTTSTKVKILKRLNDFWRMKSLMLQARRDPRVLNDPDFIRQAREYYESSSTLANQEFWNNISEDTKTKTVQHLILQEVNEPEQLRMVQTKDKAAVYIILSGSVEIQNDPNQEGVVLGPGQMFGALDLFNKVTNDVKGYRNIEDHDILGDKVVQARVRKGAYVRISMADFLDHVMVDDKEEEIRLAQAEDAKIAEIPWAELTDDDKFYIRVYKRTRDLVNRNLFAFLDSYRMVPKNARMPAFKFYHETEIYREINIGPEEPPSVYIIIHGRIRIEVETKRNKEKSHTLACKRKGKKPMIVKTYTMPILLLDEGSLLLLKDESFLIGSEGEPKKVIKPSKNTTLSRTDLIEALKQQKEKDNEKIRKKSEISLSSTDPLKSSTLNTPSASAPAKAEPLYRIRLVVESTCSYLKYPYANFTKILNDEKLIMRSMADEIKGQLNQSNHAVCSRITKLLPWLRGDMSFDVKNKRPPILEPLRPIENFAATKIVMESPDDLLIIIVCTRSATLGSFPQYVQPPVDASSVLTPSLEPSLDSPEKKKKTVDPNQSKLKTLIARMKIDDPPPSVYGNSKSI